jgi:hypothetical protein
MLSFMKVQELGVELSPSAAEIKMCGILPPLPYTSYTVVFNRRGVVTLYRLTLMYVAQGISEVWESNPKYEPANEITTE